jgi:hypothetical protein
VIQMRGLMARDAGAVAKPAIAEPDGDDKAALATDSLHPVTLHPVTQTDGACANYFIARF